MFTDRRDGGAAPGVAEDEGASVMAKGSTFAPDSAPTTAGGAADEGTTLGAGEPNSDVGTLMFAAGGAATGDGEPNSEVGTGAAAGETAGGVLAAKAAAGAGTGAARGTAAGVADGGALGAGTGSFAGAIPPSMVAIGRAAELEGEEPVSRWPCAGKAPVGSATSSMDDESSSMGTNAPVSSAVSSMDDESSSGGTTGGGGLTLGEGDAGGSMLGNFGTGGGGAECPTTVFGSLGLRGTTER